MKRRARLSVNIAAGLWYHVGEVTGMFLLKWFVRDYENTKDPAVRSACGKLSGFVGIVCNLLLFAAKLDTGRDTHCIKTGVQLCLCCRSHTASSQNH